MKLETACPGDRLKDNDGDEWERLDSGAVLTTKDGCRHARGQECLGRIDERFGPFTEIQSRPADGSLMAFGARCHRCGAEWNVDELRAGVTSGTIAVQEWTGRTFCRPVCWDAYLESEGLK